MSVEIVTWNVQMHAHDKIDPRTGEFRGKEAPHAYSVDFRAVLSPDEYGKLLEWLKSQPGLIAEIERRR